MTKDFIHYRNWEPVNIKLVTGFKSIDAINKVNGEALSSTFKIRFSGYTEWIFDTIEERDKVFNYLRAKYSTDISAIIEEPWALKAKKC